MKPKQQITLFNGSMFSNHYLEYQNSRLHYISAGNGKRSLLFFHGFGQDHSLYIPIIQSLAGQYTVYIFDLFFHGKSTWAHDEQPLEKQDWASMMDIFFKMHSSEKFTVCGYSLGGKFALATLEAFPDRCEQILLIAPDGIKTSFWYSLATYPIAFRKLFKSLIENHERFIKIAGWLNRSSLVDNGLIRFADYQMNSTAKRKRVYFSWVVFRHLHFNLNNVKRLITKHKIKTSVLVGRYDKVIKPENIRGFVKDLPHATFEIAEAGHSGLLTREVLRKYLLND